MITENECIEIVKKSLGCGVNFKLKNFNIKKASDDKIGYLGEYFNIYIDIENDQSKLKTLCYFIKTIPQKNVEHKQIIVESGVFRKEEQIYKLFEKWDKNFNLKFHPKCLFSRPDIIVLEDQSIENYYQLDNDMQLNIYQIKAVFAALANMHASSIAYDHKNNIKIGDKMNEILFETSVSRDITWFHAGLEATRLAAKKHPKFQKIEYQKFIDSKFFDKIDPVYDMMNPSTEYHNVLCHRDVWGRNIFFKDDINNNENSVSSILVDYQTCRYCPPAIDLIFFLHLNVRKQFRDEIYMECLNYYHQMLIENLQYLNVPSDCHISYREIVNSCNDMKLFGIVYDCIAATVVKLPKGFLTQLKTEQPKKYYQFQNFNRNDVIEKFLDSDQNFRDYLFEAVEELMDVIY